MVGIIVQFHHPFVIECVALGIPLAAIPVLATTLGIGGTLVGAALINYVHNALTGGGYYMLLAASLYRLRHGALQPNYVFLPPSLGAVPIVDNIILHLHIPHRVSKYMKELGYNSRLNLPVINPLPVYWSLKDLINSQFAFYGFPMPNSATITSSNTL